MSHSRALTFVLSCGLLCSALHGQKPPAAPDLLAKVEADRGTDRARAKVNTLVAKGRVSMRFREYPKVKVPSSEVEYIFVGHDRALSTVSGGGSDVVVGMTPTESWEVEESKIGINLREVNDPPRRLFGIRRATPWTDVYATATHVEEAKVRGRSCWKVAMETAEGIRDWWFVDKRTRRLVRVDLELSGEAPAEVHFSDWRRRQGVLFPFKMEVSTAAAIQGEAWTKLTVNAEVDTEQITPDEKIQAAIDKKRSERVEGEGSKKPGVCTVVTLKETHTATIRLKVKAAEISRVMAVILPEVYRHVLGQGVGIVGRPFARYHSTGAEIDVEAGMPVEKPIQEGGRVKASTLPGGKTGVVLHQGPYDKLRRSHEVLDKWMAEKKFVTRGPRWEVYVTDPGTDPDPRKWQTRIFAPLQ